MLTAPAGTPEMFVAAAVERKVTVSWSPPPVALRNGVITSYTLSCSPSPSSLPQSPSQPGPLTVAGFSPDTSYSCSVVASNSQGSGPPANTSFTTQQDCNYSINSLPRFFSFYSRCLLSVAPDWYFHLLCTCGKCLYICYIIIIIIIIIYPYNNTYCLQSSERNEKLEDITSAVLEELTDSCADSAECGISSDIINRQSFPCFPESPTHVTFRARLGGGSETDRGSLISQLESWVSGGATIIVTGVLMTVDTECSVAISSLSEGECSITTTQPPDTTASTPSSTNSTGTPSSDSQSSTDNTRLGPNMLQNLPIILFHTAYFSHLLFCFLPLFSYKIVFKVFLCTFVFRGEADCSVSSLIAQWLPEQVSLAGRGVTRLLFARYLDLRLTLNCCCIGHPCPYCTC